MQGFLPGMADEKEVNAVVKDALITKLNLIPTMEDIIIEKEKESRISFEIHMISMMDEIILESVLNMGKEVPKTRQITVVVITNKKKALHLKKNTSLDLFLFYSPLLRAIYKTIRKEWDDLNKDDESSDTNVLYLPDVLFDTKMKKKHVSIRLNFLVVSVPSINHINEEGKQNPTTEFYIDRIIGDVYDAAIKCGCKNLLISPYDVKFMERDYPDFTIKTWLSKLSDQRQKDNIEQVKFIVSDPYLFQYLLNRSNEYLTKEEMTFFNQFAPFEPFHIFHM